ncbi:hypothetical protein AB6A40_009301 [Gnathostoma spinigerum]|uniref:Transmembrane protein 107 n=1 Tax=Gnathostoma spinigerum TaxID=75299 RepID=A0ABD6F0E7_9BILA
MDCVSAYFIAVMGHATILTLPLWRTSDFVLASLPEQGSDPNDYRDLEASFVVCVVLSITFALVEMCAIFAEIPAPSTAVVSIIAHSTATILLLFLIIDQHPVRHFWIIFCLFSLSPLLIRCVQLSRLLRLKQIC